MFTQLFIDKDYKDKVKSVTNLRLISFFIWKFILGLIFYYFFTKITQNYYVSYYLLSDVKFYFSFYDYLALFILLMILDFFKFAVFENYEENVTHRELAIRIILDPKYQTIFMVINSILLVFILKILARNGSTSFTMLDKKKIFEKQNADDDLHLILYR